MKWILPRAPRKPNQKKGGKKATFSGHHGAVFTALVHAGTLPNAGSCVGTWGGSSRKRHAPPFPVCRHSAAVAKHQFWLLSSVAPNIGVHPPLLAASLPFIFSKKKKKKKGKRSFPFKRHDRVLSSDLCEQLLRYCLKLSFNGENVPAVNSLLLALPQNTSLFFFLWGKYVSYKHPSSVYDWISWPLPAEISPSISPSYLSSAPRLCLFVCVFLPVQTGLCLQNSSGMFTSKRLPSWSLQPPANHLLCCSFDLLRRRQTRETSPWREYWRPGRPHPYWHCVFSSCRDTNCASLSIHFIK